MALSKKPIELISFVCATCQARLSVRVDQAGKRVKCPDCYKLLVVPQAQLPEPDRQPRFAEIGEYEMGDAVDRPPVSTEYALVAAEVFARPVDPPPRWTFYSGVFEFPWYRSAIRRWVGLTAGLFVMGLFLTGLIIVTGMAGGTGTGLMAGPAIGFFALPFFWVALWTLSYAADSFLAIVQETAAGNNEVVWPEAGWRERVFRLLYVGYVAILAGMLGYLVKLIADRFQGPGVELLLATMVLVFPYMLLSSLASDSVWGVCSVPVARSFVRLWWGWALYYAHALLLAAPIGFALWFFFLRAPLLTSLVVSPLVSAATLIHARLLGRLAWRASL